MATGEKIRILRNSMGLSQIAFARRAGISRQALGAIEAGAYQPTVGVAMSIARELGKGVESLFGDAEGSAALQVSARWYSNASNPTAAAGTRATLGRVRGRIVAVAQAPAAFALNPAAGIVTKLKAKRAEVTAYNSPEEIDSTLLVAGCDPAASLLADWMIRHHSATRLVPVPCSSSRALDALVSGCAHCAGVHLKDAKSNDYNLPSIRRALGRRAARVVTFARWELGIAVRANSRISISTIADLAERGIRLANRERGSGARAVLDAGLKRAGIRTSAIAGYQLELGGHLEVASTIALGQADAGITVRVASEVNGLKFIPIQEERYDLVIFEDMVDSPPIKALLDALSSRRFAREINQFCGYDTTSMGQVVARPNQAAA